MNIEHVTIIEWFQDSKHGTMNSYIVIKQAYF